MTKPVIGITLDYSRKKIKDGGYARFPWYALREHYAQAVVKSGGVPVFIPYETEVIDEYLETCDGLVLPGGDTDIPPKMYGEEVTVKNISLDESNPRIDFEVKFIEAAMKTKTPMLGVCAGMQVMNVALGGSLYQDIEEQVKTNIKHGRHSDVHGENSHDIEVTEGSLLNKVTGKKNYRVNSFHHQAVKDAGKGLTVTGVAPDGIIESIEMKDHPFWIGVEWHPEFLDCEEDKKLFRALILAAEQHKQR